MARGGLYLGEECVVPESAESPVAAAAHLLEQRESRGPALGESEREPHGFGSRGLATGKKERKKRKKKKLDPCPKEEPWPGRTTQPSRSLAARSQYCRLQAPEEIQFASDKCSAPNGLRTPVWTSLDRQKHACR